jgi:hypothetical protein
MTIIEKIKEMREALQFYGDKVLTYALTQANEPRSAAHADKGRIAREALSLFPSILEEVEGMGTVDEDLKAWLVTEKDKYGQQYMHQRGDQWAEAFCTMQVMMINKIIELLGFCPPVTSPTHSAISHHKEEN